MQQLEDDRLDSIPSMLRMRVDEHKGVEGLAGHSGAGHLAGQESSGKDAGDDMVELLFLVVDDVPHLLYDRVG